MDNIILESTLTKSETFNDFNNIEEVSQVAKAMNLIKNLTPLTVDDIETAYVQIKQMPNLLSRQAIRQFDQGDIVLLYNKNVQQRMVDVFPFLTFLVKGSRYTTYIFMDKFMTLDRNEKYHVNTSILHDLMKSAVCSNAIKANYQRLASNTFLESMLTNLYTKLFVRVLNREYSIVTDKNLNDTVSYWVGKFFVKNIFQTASGEEAIESLLMKEIKYLDEIQINEARTKYNEANPQKVSELLELLKTSSARLNSLNKASFVNKWMDYFYPRALLAMDNIEYFIFMILAIKGGNNVVSIAPSELIKETKNINNLEPELIKLCS